MRAAILSVPILLAACVDMPGAGGPARAFDPIPEGQVRVAAVSLRLPTLTVTMSDGTRCTAERPEGEPAGWSGTTGGCAYALPFVVTFARGGSPSRASVEALGVPLGPDGAPGPRAEVFVTDTDGVRRLFVVPVPARLFGEAPVS